MRFAIISASVVACLWAGQTARAQDAPARIITHTILARGDFDGDGRPDTVETARIGDVVEELVPGDGRAHHIARERTALSEIGDQIAVVVRRGAEPHRLYLLMSSSRAAVAECEIYVNPPGEYAADNANGRQVLVARHDVVAILCLKATGSGALLKYWSPENGGGFPAAWLPN